MRLRPSGRTDHRRKRGWRSVLGDPNLLTDDGPFGVGRLESAGRVGSGGTQGPVPLTISSSSTPAGRCCGPRRRCPNYTNTTAGCGTTMTGPDGALYVTTSNGTSLDYILKVVPSLPPQFSAEVATQTPSKRTGELLQSLPPCTAIDLRRRGSYLDTLGGGEVLARNFNIANPDIGEVRADAPLRLRDQEFLHG